MFTFLSPLQRPQCSSTRGLRTSALVAAFVDCVELCVRGLLRFDVPHATCFGCSSWPPTLRRRRQRGHVPTAVAAGAPVASSSRHVDSHVDSHAPRCNDENLFLKATTRRTSEATDPDFASEETLLAVCGSATWTVINGTSITIPTRQFYQITRTGVQTLSLLLCPTCCAETVAATATEAVAAAAVAAAVLGALDSIAATQPSIASFSTTPAPPPLSPPPPPPLPKDKKDKRKAC